MDNEKALAVFEEFKIRRTYDEKTETCYFSVVDIVAALIQQPDYQTARKYWNKLKERLRKEGSQSVTNCHQLTSLLAGRNPHAPLFCKHFLEGTENLLLDGSRDGPESSYQTCFIYRPDLVEDNLPGLALKCAGDARRIGSALGRHGRNNHGPDVIIHFVR